MCHVVSIQRCAIPLGSPCCDPWRSLRAAAAGQTYRGRKQSWSGQFASVRQFDAAQPLVEMRLPLILLFLQLWRDVQVVSSQTETCSAPPVVPHASVSEETRKAVYEMGNVIHYTCDVGYVSFPPIRYSCTNFGWAALYKGKCSLKACELPDDIPNGYYELIHGDGFVFGATIKYFCNEGYHMVSKEDTRTCLLNRWTNHAPVCDPLSCDPPAADGLLTVTGLPDNDEPILPDRFLRFSCDVPGTHLNGSSILICGRDGQWDKPFPTCDEITCKADEIHSHLSTVGLPANKTVKVGQKVQFLCSDPYSLDGAAEIQCLPSGTWSSSFPTCTDTCTVPREIPGVRITNRVPSKLRVGESLRLACSHGKYLQGDATITCSAGGRWSASFPTCGAPAGCGRPPGLDDGDIKSSVQDRPYRHGERLEYVCVSHFTMRGGPYRTCENGEWTGEMKCLKPCTVNDEVKRTHNVDFRYRSDDKLYAPHEDHITFSCVSGTRPSGPVDMRQQCLDGVMFIPTCL